MKEKLQLAESVLRKEFNDAISDLQNRYRDLDDATSSVTPVICGRLASLETEHQKCREIQGELKD